MCHLVRQTVEREPERSALADRDDRNNYFRALHCDTNPVPAGRHPGDDPIHEGMCRGATGRSNAAKERAPTNPQNMINRQPSRE